MNRVVMVGLGLAGFGVFMLVAGKPSFSKPEKGEAKAVVAPPQPKAPAGKAEAVFVKIPEALEPAKRSEKYEEPIRAALKKADAGTVTGAGTGMRKDGGIEFVGVDVSLTDWKKGLAVLKAELTRIGAPKETELQYMRDAKSVKVEFEKAE